MFQNFGIFVFLNSQYILVIIFINSLSEKYVFVDTPLFHLKREIGFNGRLKLEVEDTLIYAPDGNRVKELEPASVVGYSGDCG